MLKKLPLYLLLVCAAVMLATSCKKNDDDTSSSTTVYSNSRTTTQVMKFYIKANADVMENLDSVFFTIDPDRSIIYNADSLPVNTKVTGLVPSVTFASSVRSVVFSVTGGTARKDTTFTYRSTAAARAPQLSRQWRERAEDGVLFRTVCDAGQGRKPIYALRHRQPPARHVGEPADAL